jgi:hypothetical protein
VVNVVEVGGRAGGKKKKKGRKQVSGTERDGSEREKRIKKDVQVRLDGILGLGSLESRKEVALVVLALNKGVFHIAILFSFSYFHFSSAKKVWKEEWKNKRGSDVRWRQWP